MLEAAEGELGKSTGGMKRPLSPPLPPESGDADASSVNEDVTELQSVTADGTQKRERKLQTFTLCGVCNIQLNSAAQAQIHYNGKSHQKRLKKLQNGKMPTSQGNSGLVLSN
ncbi:zinc finger matrin-type protein 3-like isoform X3 [Mobula hypostoma]|uniref:zinc finger matrin-type protein 3-like isoform X3 n=1 Tax=Mobula hypostoma TaxID=723540 RepID=UPI002FC2AD39